MNSYIKHIIESFDFNKVNGQKKYINGYDLMLLFIVNKIISDDNLTDEEKNYILSLPEACYKTNDNEIRQLVKNCISIFGNNCNLNWIDTSNVTDMSFLFYASDFNGNISEWDVSNVINMERMFTWSEFNSDISNWNIRIDCNINAIFNDCLIIDSYKPKQFKINEAFDFGSIKLQKKKINAFDIVLKNIEEHNITIDDYNILILYTSIYKPKDTYDLLDLINYCIKSFGTNCNLNWIDVSSIKYMRQLFSKSTFNGDISKWDVSSVTDMGSMFASSQFDNDISKWDVSNVTNMSCMFWDSKFNRDISTWNVSNVTTMDGMFWDSKFNRDISTWNVSNVTDMKNMFEWSEFNGDISQWNVSNVTDMSRMFELSKFTGDISLWNTSNVTKMDYMFANSKFIGDISKWNVSMVIACTGIFLDCPISKNHMPKEFRDL